MQKLTEGYECRDACVSIQRQLNSYLQSNINITIAENYIIHRDQIIDQNEVYNQYKKIQENTYKKDNDQHESVRLWLQSWSDEKGYNYYLGDDFSSNFTFDFLSPFQKNILMQSPYRYLDATHKTTNIKNCLLYTVVVRHPVTGTGYPAAYCFTTSHGISSIIQFLKFLKDLGCTNVQIITIDVSNVELNAINTVFPEAGVQWCLFLFARAWSSKIHEYVKTGSSETNGIVHRAIILL